MKYRILSTLCLAALAFGTFGQVVPQGPEFLIMSTLTANDPRVAIDGGGQFMAGFFDFFVGQVILRGWDGAQLQTPFGFSPEARYVSIAELGGGEFAVVWSQWDSMSFDLEIMQQTFAVDGSPLSSAAPVTLNPFNSMDANTAVVRRPGDLMVVWEHVSDVFEGFEREIRARFLPFAGPPGPPVTVNGSPLGLVDNEPEVAATADGRVLVVWSNQSCAPDDPSDGCIRGRHYTAAGNPAGPEMLINSFTTGSQTQPVVAASNDGFVVAWKSEDCGDDCIQVRRFSADAKALGPEVRADLTGADFVGYPGVGATGRGEFAVVWVRRVGAESLPFARAFDSSGQPLTGEFKVDNDNTVEPRWAATAMNDGGEFVVVWNDAFDMWGRRFKLEAIFDDGFESGDTSSWSTTVP